MANGELELSDRFDRPCGYSPALYVDFAGKDPRLDELPHREDFARLARRLAHAGQTVFVDRAQIFHFSELTGFLIPVGSPISDTTARMVLYRLNGPSAGPRAFLFEIHGAIGADSRLTPDCLQSITLSSASGRNSLNLRPVFSQTRGSFVRVIKLSLEDDEEDGGFWGVLGDVLTGAGKILGSIFGTIWDWLKETAKDLFDEIVKGEASARGIDEDGDGRTDAIIIFKTIRF